MLEALNDASDSSNSEKDSKASPSKENGTDYGREKQVGLTYGQKAVGLSFNPSNMPEVDICKQIAANAIDQMNNLRNSTTSGEVKRMASVAITEFQTAQMWAVKALTWKD